MPSGATAVVPVEATEIADERDRPPRTRRIRREYPTHWRRSGKGIGGTDAGKSSRRRGDGLSSQFGVDPVEVVRRPKVSVLSTGNELVEPDETPGPGQIRDANRFSLIAALQEAGAEVVWAGRGPDDADALRSSLINRLAESDVVITSGGVSMGDLDLIKPLLSELPKVHFRRVFMKPGKPFNFATSGDTLIFSLPGNPVSALVGFEVFIRPALRTMLGASEIDRPRARVLLDHSVRHPTASSSRLCSRRFRGSSQGIDYRTPSLLAIGVTRWRQRLDRSSPGADPICEGSHLEAILVGPLATGFD